MIRFAVLGAGVIGKVHAKALAELSEVAALAVVVDTDLAKAQQLAEEYGVEASDDLDAVLAREGDGAVDAVTVCTPTSR